VEVSNPSPVSSPGKKKVAKGPPRAYLLAAAKIAEAKLSAEEDAVRLAQEQQKEEEEAAAKRLRAAQLEPEPEPGQSRRPGPRGAPGLSLLELPDKETRSALFQRMDYNGNGGLSLAEIDKAVVELYPEFDHKRALMRALKAADASGDGFIGRSEFRRLLHCEQLAPLPVLHFCGNRGRAPETSCLPACCCWVSDTSLDLQIWSTSIICGTFSNRLIPITTIGLTRGSFATAVD
jgi:hypothetical protein